MPIVTITFFSVNSTGVAQVLATKSLPGKGVAAEGDPCLGPWPPNWGGSGRETLLGFAANITDGTFYLTGETKSFGTNGEVFVVKMDECSNILWQKTWGDIGEDVGTGVAIDGKGNVYVTGFTRSFGAGKSQIFLLVYAASNGNLITQHLYSGTQDAYANDIALDKSGNIYLTGSIANPATNHADALIVKIAPNGTVVWQFAIGGSSDEVFTRLAVSPQGAIFAVGYTLDYFGTRALIFETDVNGLLPVKPFVVYDIADVNIVNGVTADSNSNVYVTGVVSLPSCGGCGNALIMKFDGSLILQWAKSWGGSGPDQGEDIAVDSKGNLYVVGKTPSFDSGQYQNKQDWFYLKIEPKPSLSYHAVQGTTEPDEAVRVSLNSTIAGNVLIAGSSGDAFNNHFPKNQGPSILGSAPSAVVTPTLNFDEVTLTFGSVSGTEAVPSPTMANYEGAIDAFVWEGSVFFVNVILGDSRLPATGIIHFDGNNYTSPTEGHFTKGNYVATATPNVGYRFTGWSSSGGVFLPEDVRANQTDVTLNNTGTLTANFQSISLPSLPSTAPIITGAGIAVAFRLFGKRVGNAIISRKHRPVDDTS